MITGPDQSRWRNLYWVASGLVALAVILSASDNPFEPGSGPGEFGELSETVIARFPIPQGAKITVEQLTTATMPAGSVPEGSFRNLEQVIGKIAIRPVGAREPITNLWLAPKGVAGGLVIPEGYRAMTIKVDDVVGTYGFIMPGSFVDVVVLKGPASRQSGVGQGSISKTVMQNIKVPASGQDIPGNQRELSLQVKPHQAEKLMLAAAEGKLKLYSRTYKDQQ